MNRERLENSLEGIRYLLSHLHNEVTSLESSYSEVLLVLRKLEQSCEIDELTGLLRRKTFFQKWNHLLEECQKLNEVCGILMIDIDHFKKINDTLGHQTGDEVLKRVASMLKQFETPDCFSGRYGGEEFVVAARGTEAEILGLAERIRRETEKLQGPVIDANGKPSSDRQWSCTLSIGAASTPTTTYDADRLLKVADEALYEAKHKGRNRVIAA